MIRLKGRLAAPLLPNPVPQLDFEGGWQQDIIAIELLRDTRQRNWDEMKVLLKKPIREIIQILKERYKKEPPIEPACSF